MKTKTDSKQPAHANAAQRLRQMLGLRSASRPRKARAQVREQMVVEAIEPRVLLSAEALVLPPPPQSSEQLVVDAAAQALLSGQQALLLSGSATSPAINLSSMVAASLIGEAGQQAAESTRPNEVVFVDPRVADYQKLLDQALQGRGLAEAAKVEVVVLDLASDGVDQIANWLGQYQNQPLRAVHILSHGEAGELQLGTAVLDAGNVDAYAERLTSWSRGLAADADLLIYGCNVAAGDFGGAFVDRLASLTGADVAASDDRTGTAALGGDWTLEKSTGLLETATLTPGAAGYDYLLSSVTPSKSGDTTNVINVAGAQAAFRAATNLGGQLDISSELSDQMPLADLPFNGLIRTADGRTLGDLLAFRTTAGTTVLDDYLATSGTHTMGGLMDRLGDYLNGRGAYSHLESLVDNAVGSPSISFSASGDAFTVDLSLSREFLQRFGFGEELKPLGFDFQAGAGVTLIADVHYGATFNFGIGSVQLSTLDARIHTKTSTFNAAVVIGVLDAQATGTLEFDTGTLSFNSTSAMVERTSGYAGAPGYTVVKNPGDADYSAGDSRISRSGDQPAVLANADFDITGTLGNTSLATIAGGTPHVNLGFGGMTLDSATVNSVTPILTGTANVLSGQQLLVSVSNGSNTVTYAVTPAGNGDWSLNMATATAQSGSLTLVNGQTYSVLAQIKRGSKLSASTTGTLSVATGGLQVKSISTNTITPTLSGAATLLSGQQLKITVTDQANASLTATYAVTPSAGNWSLNLASATPESGSLTLVNGHTYSVYARISEASQTWSAATGTALVDTALAGTTVTATVNGSASAISRVSATSTAIVPWSSIQPAPLVLTTTNFSKLQAFSSLDSAELVRMLQDLGTYLELLRDSGKFDALLPFTGAKLGETLDFSKAMNEVLDNQLAITLLSGLTGSSAISPVLPGNVAFDLYLQRPADDRTSVITITVDASETTGFVHVNQLAALVGQKISTAVNGLLGWQGSLFDVSETLKGGLTVVGATRTEEEQTLQVHATAGSYQLKLGAGGTTTGPISVLAAPIEVQQALESVLGVGNVIVTGRPKFYQISFTGSLANTDLAALQAVAGSDVVAGSSIDVTAGEFYRGSDGLTWGKLSVSQANPGEFSVLRVAQSSGLSVQLVSGGSDTEEAVQRLFVVHGGAGTFVLKGVDTAGNAFTTAALAYNASTSAIATALGAVLTGVTGLSVADVTADYAADNKTRVFDIAFGMKNGTDYGAYAAMTVETTGWGSAVPALAVVETRQSAADAVGATAAANEIQRLSIANASGGSFSFGITLDALFYQSDAIAYGSSAADIKTALVNMFKRWKADIGTGELSVTAVAGHANTWDVEFTGALSVLDQPQLRINSLALTSPAGGSSYGSLTRLGFAGAGQDFQINAVTSFATLNEMLQRFQQAVSASGITVSPTYDAATRSLTFSVKLALPESTVAVPLALAAQIGDLSALSTDATLDLTSASTFEGKIGLDFANLNTFALRAGGTYKASITANATDKTVVKWSAGSFGIPSGTANFSLVFDGESYDLALDSANTSSNTTRSDLAADFQAVLNAQAVLSGGVLDRLGYSTVGQAVTAGLSSASQLQFNFIAPVSNVKLVADNSTDAMQLYFGFKSATAYPSAKAVVLAPAGQLSAAAHFQLKLDQSAAVSVTVPVDSGNTTIADLVADINTALKGISVSSHAYLGSSGLGFSKLGDAVLAIVRDGQIELVTQSAKLASLQILINGRDTASTELGFTPGQFASTSGAYVFLQDASVAADYSAVVNGQVGTTPATLTTAGKATLGMLDLSFSGLKADYSGSMAFSFRNGLTGALHDRISLNDLFDSAATQTALLGMGSNLSTSDTTSATSAPFQSNGQLLRDVGLSVTVGNTVLDVVVTKASTSSNSSIAELAADIDTAIHTALLSTLGTDPYASHTFVAVTDIGTPGSPLNVLGFTAPTTTLTLADNPTQIYDAATGVLATDLRLSVAVAGLINPVDVIIKAAATSDYTALADLVTKVGDAIDLALASARNGTIDATVQANIDTLIARTDLVGQAGGALTLKSDVVSAKPVTLKNLAVAGRLLESDYITAPAYRDAAGTVGTTPTASLQFSGIGLFTPASISASGLVPATTITITVSNAAALFAGSEPEATVTVVPADGLGTLTPLKDISWADIQADLGQLGSLFGQLGELGPFGELGRALPLLGTSVSQVFNFTSRFAAIDTALAAHSGVGLNGLQAALGSAFGIDASAIGLQLNATSGQEALRITLPYRIVLDQALALELIFDDSALLSLFSPTQQAMLAGLVGAITRVKDAQGAGKLQLHADITFNLDFGIDLSNTASKGELFLYDHVAAGAAGLAGDTGTYARIDDFSASASGVSFESSQGIYRLGVAGGSATVNVASGSGFMLASDASDGAADGRLYLGAYGEKGSADATTLKQGNFQVIFDGSAVADLPMTLMVSDQLGQLAIEQIDGFINPLPLGTMELDYRNLGDVFAAMGGKGGFTLLDGAEVTDSHTVVSSQIAQAVLPARPATGNGVGTTTPEGAPVDNDNEGALATVNPDPYLTSTEGAGASTAVSGVTVGSSSLFGSGAQTNPTAAGYDISLVLPDFEYWQQQLSEVLKGAIGESCDPSNPINGPLIFLLRDPTIIVNTVDTVLESIQKGLDAFSDVLDLPIIGDQLKEATQFVADLRSNVVDAIKTALASAVDKYGGLDNALRMFLFDTLTTDTNGDYIIEASELSSNVFLNFLRDYNGDNLITPDDIVVEYVAGFIQPDIDPGLADYLGVSAGNPIPAVLGGQRTAWVTSGINVAATDASGAAILHDDGTPCYIGEAGQVVLDSSLQAIVDDVANAIDSVQATAEDLFTLFSGIAEEPSFFSSLSKMVSFVASKAASGYGYQDLLKDVFGAGVTAAALSDIADTFRPSTGALAADAAVLKANQVNGTTYIPKAVLTEFKQAIQAQATEIAAQVAIGQSTAIQFRMNLGQTYTPSLDLSFDIGVPGLNLSLDGGIALNLNWDLYLGFGIDLTEGFYVVTNMPGNAGIGEVTTYSTDPALKGVATGVESNIHDTYIDNLWLVGKPGQTAAVQELQATVDVFLAPGASGNAAQLNAELFFLNGTMTDNWDGWIKDNDTGVWGSGTDSMNRLSGTLSPTYGRTTSLFDGDSGADGSRTRLQLHFGVDLKDVGLFGIPALSVLTTGRLTFTDLSNAKLSDLIEVEWDARAQINLHMELGVSLGGEGYLPSILGDFHMTWMANNENQYVQQIDQFFASGYDKLFKVGNPSIWFSDVYLDAGTFFTRFLNPIVSVIQDVTDPIMPVIDALTTPIPGLSELMGRDYSVLELASDMSALFGGVAEVDFAIAMVRLLDVIDGLPTGTARMLIPVAQALIVTGTTDRKLNLAALPAIPGLPNIDVPVDLPYLNLADVDVKDGALEFSLQAGVGWKQDTTLLNVFQGNTPPLSFDFALNADVKVPAPYIDVTPVNFTIPGVLDRSGNVAQFKLNIKAGWTDLRLSDILTGNFAPRFDVTVVMPDIDLTPELLPQLKLLLPKMTWSIGIGASRKTWTWAAGGEVDIRWPDAVAAFVSSTNIKTIDLTAPSFDVDLGGISAFLPTVQVMWPTVHWVGLGKEFVWEQTSSTNLGWSSLISDSGLLAALVDPARTVVVDMPDVWLPSLSLVNLLPDFNWSLSLPGLPSLPSLNIGLPDIDVPGQQTVGPMDALNNFKTKLRKPGNALTFPIIDDPLNSVINLLTGKPADLMLFKPAPLDVKVGFRVSYPIYPPLYVGIGGEIRLQASLTLGFDTYGISKFFDSHNLIDIFDGFYVGDNIVNGVDQPEIRLDAKLVAFAELNAFIIRGGVEGGIKLTGTVDIYDEDRDNKYRASELIAAVSEDPLDVVSMSLRGSAYIAAYVDIFLFFGWERVWEWTFMDVTLFQWEHDPAAKKPILASMSGSTLSLHTGSGIGSIDGQESVTTDAADRKRRSTDDGNETYTLSGSGGTVDVAATLTNGQTYNKTFVGVSKVKAFAGAGNDTIDASALDRPVLFIAGSGIDVLIGGSADDVLIGSDTGTATLTGNGGNDLLIARGGTTIMVGGNGNDIYRYLGNWGSATITDTVGSNIVDFSRQTVGVTIDDAFLKAQRGTNSVQWASATTLDEIRGGSGSDIVDLSGDQANMLVSITGTNAGWVRGSASGMTQSSFASNTAQAIKDAGDNAGRGFRFTGFENLVGGQGSDVFRMRDGASLTGSLSGDTAAGLHHHADGNEIANARNTIDFSEYTRAVQVNEEGNSAFGSANATAIKVRGFHNIFGGQAGDWLVGDGRNNLIVGNDGTDTLEGLSAHDLLVADTFVTYKNLLSGQTRPSDSSLKNVSDYLTLQAAGAAEFGAASRNWIWKGQTLENHSLSITGSQTLKGGSGNDVILGALGGDIINIGGSGDGNDTIMADLGRVQIDFMFRSALSATSFGSKGGGGDTIYLGGGSNLIIAGGGRDTIFGADTAGSQNIILADNGTVQFRTGEAALAGQLKLTFAVSGSYTHMLDYVEAPVAETGGTGNDDTLRLGSGSAIVFGGAGLDAISFTAATSTGANKRFVAGDHGRLGTDANGSMTSFASLDLLASSGGKDTISIGSPADLLARHLGSNYLIGGMGGDTILVSASYDPVTGVVIHGAARSVDVILADNGSITRPDGNSGLDRVLSTQASAGLGGDDLIITANGDKTLVGGVGNDTITVATSINSTRLIAGDNADITYASPGSFTGFSTLDSVQANGGVDLISVGTAASSSDLGSNYILGGMEADRILVAASWDAGTATASFGMGTSSDVILADNGSINRLSGSSYLSHVYSTEITAGLGGDDLVLAANGDKTIVGGVGNDTVTLGTTSVSTRLIAGDNAELIYDVFGNFTLFQTSDLIAATGGRDTLRIGEQASTGDLGFNVIFGGMGADEIYISAAYDAVSKTDRLGKGVSEDIVIGDNGRIERSASTGSLPNQLLQIATTQNDKGGDDRILTANGGKVLVGGFGADILRARDGDNLVMGDNAQIDFDAVSRNGVLRSVISTDIVIGANDTITLEEGFKLVAGGFGADSIQIDADNIGNVSGSATGSDAIGAAVWALGTLSRITSVVGVAGIQSTAGLSGAALAAAQTGNRGRNGRFVAGDNVRFGFDDQSGLIEMVTTDPIAATGGADAITLGAQGIAASADLGYQVVMGGMGADTITVRDQAASSDILLGDNGELLRRARVYAPLSITSTVAESGGSDTILTGRGDKIVIGGAGADLLTLKTDDLPDTGGTATASNRSIVLGDSGVLAFDVAGGGALQRIESLNPSLGGDDVVSIGDGDVSFIGGYGRDTLAVNSNRSAFRLAAGDNARFGYAGIAGTAWQAEDLIAAQTLDQTAANGDADTLRFGVVGSLTGVMGQAILIGGMGADRLTVTGESADALLIGDNAQLSIVQGSLASGPSIAQTAIRWTNGQAAPHSTSYIENVATLSPELGAGDVLETTSGSHVLIGGQGADLLRAGRGDGVVFGDGASLSYSAGVLRQATSFGVAQGGADTIELGAGGGSSDGHKIVVGGFGADSITISSVQGSGASPETARERVIAGDNATVILDANGRLTGFSTLDTDSATGGGDIVQLSVSAGSPAVPGLTDLNVVAGGMGGDTLNVSAANRYVGVVSGDNLDYRRSDGSAVDPNARYRSLFATVLQPFTGGDDSLRLSSGELIAFGGAGSDRIEASTVAGDTGILFGDAGTVIYAADGSGQLAQINTLADSSGGNDTVSAGAGSLYLLGGAGGDVLAATAASNATRIVLGDTGQVNFSAGVPGLIQTSTDDAPDASSTDSITVPLTDTTGATPGSLGHNFVIGGAGLDTLTGSISSNDRVMPGSGMLDASANGGAGMVVSVTVLGQNGEFGYGTTLGGTVDGIVLVGAAQPGGGTGGTGGTDGGLVIDYRLTGSGEVSDGLVQGANGRIAYPSLTSGLATFAPTVIDGEFGSLILSQDGSWAYALVSAAVPAVRTAQGTALQALSTDEVRQEVFHVTTTDGSSTTVTITVTGKPLAVYAHAGNALEAGGIANATAGVDAVGTAVSGGVLDNALGVTAGSTSVARVSSVSFGAAAGTVGVVLAGRYGSLTLNADGSYHYVVDNTAAEVEQLARDQVVTDQFAFIVTRDGGRSVSSTLDIRVTGTNDTPVVATSGLTGSITEALVPVGILSDSGSVTFSDVDLADGHTVLPSITASSGALGSLSASVSTLGDAIGWTYNVAASAVEYLAAGEQKVETFTLTLDDGQGGTVARTVTVTITGTNDTPVALADSGAIREGDTLGRAAGQGVLANDSDVDASDTLRVGAVAAGAASPSADGVGRALTGIYGTLTLAGDGSYVYRADTAAGQALHEGESATEVFSYSVIDEHGGVTTSSLTLILTGTADQPVISGDNSGAVKVGRNLASSGQLTARDADAGESGFKAESLAGLYGSLVIDLAGQWTYTADPALIPSGFSAPERIVVSTLDGTPVAITVSINGPDAILVAAVSPMASGSVFGSSVPTLVGSGGIQEPQAGGNVSMTMDSGPAAATATGAPRTSGVPTAAPVPVAIADTPLGVLNGTTDNPAALVGVSAASLSGSSGSAASQPRGVLGSSDQGRGADLGLGVSPTVLRSPVVIPQTRGPQIFHAGVALGESSMVQSIRLASSLITVPVEMDRQDSSAIMATESVTTPTLPPSPDTGVPEGAAIPESGTTVTPLPAVLPVLPLDLLPVAEDATAALPDSSPALPEAEAGIDSSTTLAVLAGSVVGAQRIQWNLPDPAAARKARRASSRRAA